MFRGLILFVPLFLLIGCVTTNVEKTHFDYADEAVDRNDYAAAYRHLEDYLSENSYRGSSINKNKAVKIIKADKNYIKYALTTFSERSFKDEINAWFGRRDAVAENERKRLNLFRVIAPYQEFHNALNNFDLVFPGYYIKAEVEEVIRSQK